jgi:hypothetical protein
MQMIKDGWYMAMPDDNSGPSQIPLLRESSFYQSLSFFLLSMNFFRSEK